MKNSLTIDFPHIKSGTWCVTCERVSDGPRYDCKRAGHDTRYVEARVSNSADVPTTWRGEKWWVVHVTSTGKVTSVYFT